MRRREEELIKREKELVALQAKYESMSINPELRKRTFLKSFKIENIVLQTSGLIQLAVPTKLIKVEFMNSREAPKSHNFKTFPLQTNTFLIYVNL